MDAAAATQERDDICQACGRHADGECPHKNPADCAEHKSIERHVEAESAAEARRKDIAERVTTGRFRALGPLLPPVPQTPESAVAPPKDGPWWWRAGIYVLEKHGVGMFFTLLIICAWVVQAYWNRQDRAVWVDTMGKMASALQQQASAIQSLQSDVQQMQTTLNIDTVVNGPRRQQAQQPAPRK